MRIGANMDIAPPINADVPTTATPYGLVIFKIEVATPAVRRIGRALPHFSKWSIGSGRGRREESR